MCHGLRLTKQDDYFLVTFILKQEVFAEAAGEGSSKNWLEPKTKPPLPSLTKFSLSKSATHSEYGLVKSPD